MDLTRYELHQKGQCSGTSDESCSELHQTKRIRQDFSFVCQRRLHSDHNLIIYPWTNTKR